MKSIATIIFIVSTTLVLGDVVFPDGSKGAQASDSPVEPYPPVGFARPSFGTHSELSSVSQDPAQDGSQLSDDPANPQARFFGLFGGKKGGLFGGGGGGGGLFGGGGGGLFGGGIGGLFCKSCSFEDPIKADRCCKRGEVECCGYSQIGSFGGGFGGAIPPVPGFGGGHGGHGGHIDKFGHGGPPGYVPAGAGFGGAGFGGAGFGGGFGGYGGLKPGYCPRANLFSGIGNLFKLRDGEVPLDEEHNPTVLNDHHQKGNLNELKRRALRQVKFEDSKDQKVQDEHITNSDEPTQRFLPVLSGLPNPFCRDQCFNDFDCPSALKCCINFGNCRECSYPRFNNFF